MSKPGWWPTNPYDAAESANVIEQACHAAWQEASDACYAAMQQHIQSEIDAALARLQERLREDIGGVDAR